MQKIEEDRIKRVFADILVSGATEARLLDETDDNYLSTAVAHDWLKKFGNILSISDLIPRNEEMLKVRLAAKHLATPVTVEEKPVTAITVEAAKNSIVALLRKAKAA